MNCLRSLERWYRGFESHSRHEYLFVFVLCSCWVAALGRAVAQAVSRWFPTAATRVRIRAACGVCDGQSGTEAGFLRVLRYPLSIIIPPISPSS
jgi:hypothetical protein